MPLLRTLALALLVVSTLPAAELRTLTGKTYKGELVSADEKGLVFKTDAETVTVPAADVLQLDLVPAAELPPLPNDPYTLVELTDGTTFHCRSFALKGKQAELQLLSGQVAVVPLTAVAAVLREANDPKVRQDWQTVLAKRVTRDLLAVKSGGVLNVLEGTLGDGDAKGERVEFEPAGRAKGWAPLTRVHGLSFLRKPDPAAPPALCKVTDAGRNRLTAAKVTFGPKGFRVATPAGAELDYPADQLARLDFSRGKLAFLSDLEPAQVKETSTEDRIDHYRRDKNLDNGPISLAGVLHAKGLTLHAYTELVYDLGGDFKELKATVGIDDLVGVDGHVRLTVEGDGRELFRVEIQRKDPPKPIAVDISNVKRLRIEVRSVGLLDLGNHLTLADAKVSK